MLTEDTLSNAHEHAYSALTAAAQALEGPGTPTLADFKDARDLAKSAHETLDSAYKLLSKGIHHVIDGEGDEETKLFKPNGEPQPEADLTAAPAEEPAPAPEPDLTLPALGCDGVMDAEIVDPEGEGEGEEGNGGEEVPVDALDDLTAKARELVVADGKVTTKSLRAAFSISYGKAKAIMDRLIAEGLIDEKGEAL